MFPFIGEGGGYYYYIIVGLQIFCGYHAYQRGNLQRWIWLIVFLPVIGSAIYLFSEVFSGQRMRGPKIDVGAIINPGAKIKKLEDDLRFTDTFANRIKLADAYLASGQTDKAVELYETSLTGTFADNEHALSQLMTGYYNQNRYEDAIAIANKINRSQKFPKSKAHMLYAMALENTGQTELAEKEFKAMKGRYSCFEQRYQYGLFLKRAARYDDAHRIFTEIIDEVPHLGPIEKKTGREWFGKSREQLKAIANESVNK
ncbi:hypothetical protein BDD43_5623 [Mucilaginibacter gracilis]|uniref:Tetratricopeptide repeat protein n=1 Tax=Mucilaginibacter gracilis TaxID=423350 RepID=A0A495JAD5_9SPHI|nr:tetratricopeptide repeat protein [Mucilaginibacter gracilis]RKR85354.1 hypothetical protein BDD43_5623 [Mucilaginibacter gracilis]